MGNTPCQQCGGKQNYKGAVVIPWGSHSELWVNWSSGVILLNVYSPVMSVKLHLINFTGRAAGVVGGPCSHGSYQGWGVFLIAPPSGGLGEWRGLFVSGCVGLISEPLREVALARGRLPRNLRVRPVQRPSALTPPDSSRLRLSCWRFGEGRSGLTAQAGESARGSPIPPTVARAWSDHAMSSPALSTGLSARGPGRCHVSPRN